MSQSPSPAPSMTWEEMQQPTPTRQRMRQSPLMDGKRFALEVEKAYRQMWRRWCLEKTSAFWETFGRE